MGRQERPGLTERLENRERINLVMYLKTSPKKWATTVVFLHNSAISPFADENTVCCLLFRKTKNTSVIAEEETCIKGHPSLPKGKCTQTVHLKLTSS